MKINEEIYDLSKGIVNLMSFYNKHDDVYRRLYSSIQEGRHGGYGGPGAAYDDLDFECLSKQEQYDIWRKYMSAVDVKDVFVNSYQEEDIEYLGDKMAQYYVDNGIMSKSQFWLDVKDKGGQKVFEAFNRHLFKGKKEELTIENKILTWDEYFMSLAHLSGLRSKDPNTQVGACIVNDNKRIIGIGYNGMPYGCDDYEYPWNREGDFMETKYPYVVHAELNAILNSTSPIAGCSIYVSLFPCNECAKAIIQSGVTEVVYENDKYAETDSVKAAKRMFASADVKLRQIESINVAVNVEAIL